MIEVIGYVLLSEVDMDIPSYQDCLRAQTKTTRFKAIHTSLTAIFLLQTAQLVVLVAILMKL